MSKRKKDILSIKDNVAFLKAYQKKLEKIYQILPELCYPDDFAPMPEGEVLTTPPDAERAARLADDYGFDGSLFRGLSGNDDPNPTSPSSMKCLKKMIVTIPRIIAKIENTDKSERGWHIENGQVFYKGIDLQFPAGQIQDVMEKLVGAEGKTVSYKKLEEITTLDKVRHYKSDIVKILKARNIPFEIKTLTYAGYKLQKKTRS